MSLLSICSLNIRGFGDRRKTDSILLELRNLKHDIFLIQETHINNHFKSSKIDEKWEGKIIWSYGIGKSAGCAIFIKKCFNGKILDFETDSEENFHSFPPTILQARLPALTSRRF